MSTVPLAIVSTSPHVRTKRTTRGIMLDVCIALLPALGAAIWLFGLRALAITLLSVACCVGFEALWCVLLKRPQTIGDCSAAVTGMLLAFNLPATLPLWMVPIGALVAIVVVKLLFGGVGQNFANPAITARIVLMLSFTLPMTTWNAPTGHSFGADAIATATPLKLLGGEAAGEALPTLWQMFLGQHGGSLGETCALALLLGFAWLLFRKVVSPIAPLCFVGTVALLSLLKGGPAFMAYEVLGGGLLLGAVFMATDYSTTPVSSKGKVVFAVGCGLLTCLIRFFGNMPEGVSFSILMMNLLVSHIERFTAPRVFGKEHAREKA
jgi:electron transport complex protein RnfD